MVAVQAVYEGHFVAALLQDGGYGEQAQGLAPLAVGGEVIDPRVDQ